MEHEETSNLAEVLVKLFLLISFFRSYLISLKDYAQKLGLDYHNYTLIDNCTPLFCTPMYLYLFRKVFILTIKLFIPYITEKLQICIFSYSEKSV